MAFSTIEPTPGLDEAMRRRAHRVGPPAVAVATSYPSLLRSAGFVDVAAADLTAEYRTTQIRWIEATDRWADGIRAALGPEAFSDRVAGRRQTLRAIEAGVLSRYRYLARRAP